MAEIKPFRAWRYNSDLTNRIGELTSPLFDVATEKHKHKLYSNPYNSIHISIPCGERPAKHATRILLQWKAEGCLVKDDRPGLYVYYQYFTIPGDPKEYCRKGFICKIRIYDWHENVILRHENTMPHSVCDQIDLLAATRLNASPTHALYTDENFELENHMDKCMQNPICETEDYQGTRDVLGIIRDPQTIADFVNLMSAKHVILADGHHRYASSLAYMKQQMAANAAHTGAEPYNYHLTWLTNTEAEDLKILPTHRLIKNVNNFSELHILEKLAEHFFVIPISNPEDVNEVIAGKKWTFGLMFRENAYQVRLKPDSIESIRWNFPYEIKILDLTVLHYFIIQEILGIKGKEQSISNCIDYERSFAACWRKVITGEAQLALITNELSINDVKKVCVSGCTLPQKSTYFWPKAVCGFVFSSI